MIQIILAILFIVAVIVAIIFFLKWHNRNMQEANQTGSKEITRPLSKEEKEFIDDYHASMKDNDYYKFN